MTISYSTLGATKTIKISIISTTLKMRAVSNPAKHAGRASWIFIIRTCLLHLWTHRFWKLSLGKQGLLVHSSLPIKEFTEVIIMGRNQCMICSVFLYLILSQKFFSPLILSPDFILNKRVWKKKAGQLLQNKEEWSCIPEAWQWTNLFVCFS